MPAAIKLAVSTTEPATPLERLRQDRAGLTHELAELTGVAAKLRATASAGDALSAELDKLAEIETAEVKVWAAGLCVGPAPKFKSAERQALAVKMAATNATADAARGALADTDAQVADLTERLAFLNDHIEQAIFDQIEREHGDVVSEFVEAIEKGSQLATRISGLALLFRETGNSQRAAAIFATKLPAVSTNPREVQLASDAWARRVAALRSGSPS
jgi:hypothetical protein